MPPWCESLLENSQTARITTGQNWGMRRSRRLPRSRSYFCHLRAGNWNYISRRLAKIGRYKKNVASSDESPVSLQESIILSWLLSGCCGVGVLLEDIIYTPVLPVCCCWPCRFLYDQNFWNLFQQGNTSRYKAMFTVHLDWDMASTDPDLNKMEQLGDVVKRDIHVTDVQWINLQKLRLAPSFVPQKHVIVRKML